MHSESPEFKVPDLFLADVQLAQSATALYQQTSEIHHLNEAVAAWNQILKHPDLATATLTFRLAAFNDGSGAYFRRYWVTGQLADLNQAVQYLQQALDQTPLDWSDRPSRCSNLGSILITRYRHTGNITDLEQSIQLCETAVHRTPEDSPELPARLTNLGHGLSARYRLTGHQVDLEQSLSVYEEAVNKTSPENPDLPSRLSNWGTALEDYYHHTGQLADLERALGAYVEAMGKTPPHSPDLPMYLNNLGNGLRNYYLQTNRLDILNDAITCCDQAVTATASDSPDQPGYLTNLGNALRNRYGHTGSVEDLDRAIRAYQISVEITPIDSTYRPMFLHNWAVGLRDRYLHAGNPADLEQAIQGFEDAVNQSPPGSSELPGYLSNLGNALDNRYGRTGSLEDLERAITTHRQAVEQTPDGSPSKPIHLNNLGNALRNRHTRTRNLTDLEQAIAVYQQAVELTLPDSVFLASRLNNLANSLRDRYIQTENLADLAATIQNYRQAIAQTPSGSSEIAPIQNNLGNALRDQFHHTGQLSDLNQAITAYEQGIEATSPHSPELPGRQNNLASTLKDRFTQTTERSDLEQATDLFEQAATLGLQVAPEAAVLASRSWGEWATERQSWHEAVTAYRYSLQAIAQLFRTQLFRASKETWLREVQGISAQAAFALAKVGDLPGAVVALEQGLARLLSEALERDRADLERLKTLGQGELCDRYQAITERWHSLIHGRAASTYQTDADWTAAMQAVRVELEEAITAIRQVDGYEDFLQPPAFNVIQSAAQVSPLVYIVVTEVGGLALVVEANGKGVEPVWLPKLTELGLRSHLVGTDEPSSTRSYLGAYSHWQQNQQNKQARKGWFNALDNTTRWLWQVLMGPLVKSLATIERAVLIPVGVLGLLPLHAAWTEDAEMPTGRCYAMDRLCFTYAPNARALIAGRAIVNRSGSERLLAIAAPQPVNSARLENAEYEAAIATSMFSQHHILKQTEATCSTVLAELPGCSILHFACHGYANLDEPLTSGLVMANDELLSLLDLLELRLTGARLAILSACETGIPGTTLPDEVISLPTGLLQAGFAGVAASLWAVEDISTTMLMFRFYELWRLKNLEPSEALRRAQQWLRNTTNREKSSYFKAMLLGQNTYGVDKAIPNRLYKSLVLADPDEYKFSHSFYWAVFSYLGI
ncbi:MAG: CHAT domain-containing protein [Cyanobacteria bacterium J06560_5]